MNNRDVTIMSESDVPLLLEFDDEIRIEVMLDRVLGPIIIEEIKSRLPIEGRAAFLRGELKITLGINRGNLKPTKEVKRGDIAYMPLGDSLCVYTEDMQTFSQVNIIGRVMSEDQLVKLQDIRRGSKVIVRSNE